MWAYIESFTLSDVSKLYSITDNSLQKMIATEFDLKCNNGYRILSNYLYCLTFLRNICAHGGRLFNRRFNTKPNLSKKEKALLPKDDNGISDNSKLFGYIINIMRMAQPNDWQNFKNEIINLCSKYPFVNMSYYGFCDNWYNKLG
jgi:abortive infection bacteriophage resistance protein